MRPSNLQAKILEMTLAAFGTVACGGSAAPPASSPNVPRATEVASPASPHARESSCSAAGCGASANASNARTDPASETKPADNALASAPGDTPKPVAATSAPAKPVATKHATPRAAKKPASKSADDGGCGAGSCGAPSKKK